MALAVCDFSNDIKGIVLQPSRKVTSTGLPDKELFGLIQEEFCGVIDEGLVLDQGAHGKSRVDTAAELGVEIIVGGAEERR